MYETNDRIVGATIGRPWRMNGEPSWTSAPTKNEQRSVGEGLAPPANEEYDIVNLMRERNNLVTFPRRGRGTAKRWMRVGRAI